MRITVEILSKDDFWRDAVHVEWGHRYPGRQLDALPNGIYLIESAWLESLKQVAAECNSEIVVGPSDPSRRSWFRQFIPKTGI